MTVTIRSTHHYLVETGSGYLMVDSGWAGGLLCLGAVFAPSFLLVIGTLPFWVRLRRPVWRRCAMRD